MNSLIIDGLLTIAAGIYACLIAFGAVRLSKDNAKEDEWRKRWGGVIKIAAPLLVICGLFSVMRGL